MKILRYVIILSLALTGILSASEVPSDPILRIETGMHTAMIRKIGIDERERYLVTASNDKTLRVWELSTGRFIRTIRPPIGKGNEGRLDSVALSPDGKVIATGGWTGWDWDGTVSIYLFDLNTGALIKRAKGLPNIISHLTYSRDGRYLVACLGGNGIRVYETSDYSLIKEDRDYGDMSLGADFDNSGRLVTSSLDGYIRLYDEGFKLIAKKKTKGGNIPLHVSFSTDGSRIVVGFENSTNIEVLSGKDLSYLYSPDTIGIDKGSLGIVTWSSDGRFIYAGGRYWKDGVPMFKWDREGKGIRKEIITGTGNTIMHILPLKGGGLVFGSAEPAFGVIDSGDEVTTFKSPSIADYRNMREKFLISHDGSVVQFGYKPFGALPASFSIEERSLEIEPKDKGGLKPPITIDPELNITDWKDSTTPRLNGRKLKLEPHEISWSLAIAPDRESFLLGTEWYLRLFDRDGNEIWQVPAPSPPWAVNISGDGKVAVAAFGDGTIRWYRLKDGKELLSLFPHRDRKRWVVWTPKGYYDASPQGDDLIGWHINNGKDKESDFFPVSRFRNIYYRPDVVAKVINILDEERAIELANKESGRRRQELTIQQALPPVVRILSPADGSEVRTKKITLRYLVKSPSGEPVTGIRVLVDGRPVSAERGVKIVGKEDIKEIKVIIPERDCEVSVLAENRYSVSEPATARLLWAGKKTEEYIRKPRLYVLAIGVGKYKDESLRLRFASKDARDFVEVLSKQKGKLYEDVVVRLLTDEKATKGEILDGLDWIQREITSKDVAMVFLAGHGVNDQAGVYYFLPADVDTEKLKRTGIAFSDIKNTVVSLAGKTILFVDTCHSGNVMGARRSVADITGVVNELSSAENGVVVFASSTGRQYSLEDPAWGNGAFTKALVEGLSGKADLLGKGKITINMLDAYVAERVKEFTKGRQTPTTTKPQTVPDFPIAVK